MKKIFLLGALIFAAIMFINVSSAYAQNHIKISSNYVKPSYYVDGSIAYTETFSESGELTLDSDSGWLGSYSSHYEWVGANGYDGKTDVTISCVGGGTCQETTVSTSNNGSPQRTTTEDYNHNNLPGFLYGYGGSFDFFQPDLTYTLSCGGLMINVVASNQYGSLNYDQGVCWNCGDGIVQNPRSDLCVNGVLEGYDQYGHSGAGFCPTYQSLWPWYEINNLCNPSLGKSCQTNLGGYFRYGGYLSNVDKNEECDQGSDNKPQGTNGCTPVSGKGACTYCTDTCRVDTVSKAEIFSANYGPYGPVPAFLSLRGSIGGITDPTGSDATLDIPTENSLVCMFNDKDLYYALLSKSPLGADWTYAINLYLSDKNYEVDIVDSNDKTLISRDVPGLSFTGGGTDSWYWGPQTINLYAVFSRDDTKRLLDMLPTGEDADRKVRCVIKGPDTIVPSDSAYIVERDIRNGDVLGNNPLFIVPDNLGTVAEVTAGTTWTSDYPWTGSTFHTYISYESIYDSAANDKECNELKQSFGSGAGAKICAHPVFVYQSGDLSAEANLKKVVDELDSKTVYAIGFDGTAKSELQELANKLGIQIVFKEPSELWKEQGNEMVVFEDLSTTKGREFVTLSSSVAPRMGLPLEVVDLASYDSSKLPKHKAVFPQGEVSEQILRDLMANGDIIVGDPDFLLYARDPNPCNAYGSCTIKGVGGTSQYAPILSDGLYTINLNQPYSPPNSPGGTPTTQCIDDSTCLNDYMSFNIISDVDALREFSGELNYYLGGDDTLNYMGGGNYRTALITQVGDSIDLLSIAANFGATSNYLNYFVTLSQPTPDQKVYDTANEQKAKVEEYPATDEGSIKQVMKQVDKYDGEIAGWNDNVFDAVKEIDSQLHIDSNYESTNEAARLASCHSNPSLNDGLDCGEAYFVPSGSSPQGPTSGWYNSLVFLFPSSLIGQWEPVTFVSGTTNSYGEVSSFGMNNNLAYWGRQFLTAYMEPPFSQETGMPVSAIFGDSVSDKSTMTIELLFDSEIRKVACEKDPNKCDTNSDSSGGTGV